MKSFFSKTRNQFLLGIGLVAIGVGLTAKHVTSYPTECSPFNSIELGLVS